jgi:SH3 domain-containing YSC84-like protein 1
MKYPKILLLLAALVVWTLPVLAKDSPQEEAQKAEHRLQKAAHDLNQLVTAGDKGIPQSILEDANCVAVVPKFIKGGFVFGAEHGKGVATCRDEAKRWSAPAFFTITGGSWGAQIGVSNVDFVMLFMDEQGARQLMSNNWKIGADAGIAAGPFGRDVSASTSAKFNTGILTYSRAKGVYIGAVLNGANVRADQDAIRGFYGRDYSFRELLTGHVRPPQAAQPFLAEVNRSFRTAEASK